MNDLRPNVKGAYSISVAVEGHWVGEIRPHWQGSAFHAGNEGQDRVMIDALDDFRARLEPDAHNWHPDQTAWRD